MKQIYYLATAEKEHRFDTVFETVEGVVVFYDLGKIPSLVAFIQRERALGNQNFLVIDLQGADFSNAHVLSAVQFLRKFSMAELVFIGAQSQETTALFGNLSASFHIRNLLTEGETTPQKLEQALLGQTSPLAFTERILAQGVQEVKSAVKALEIPDGLVISVGIAGAIHRCGTTTQSFALARLLDKVGFHTAIHDVSGQLASLLTACYRSDLTVDEHGDLHLFGLSICQQMREGYTAYVRDFGVLTTQDAQEWANSDLSAMVTTTKLWELDSVIPTVRLAKQSAPQCLVMMASFSDEAQSKELAPVLGEMMLLPWRPDVWSHEVPSEYDQTFLPLLRIACGCG